MIWHAIASLFSLAGTAAVGWVVPLLIPSVAETTAYWILFFSVPLVIAGAIMVRGVRQREAGRMTGDDRSVRNIFGNNNSISTGDTWHRTPDRFLDDRLKADIQSRIRMEWPVVMKVATDQEAFRFAEQTEKFLRSLGIKDIRRIDVMMQTPPMVGQNLAARDHPDYGEVNLIEIGHRENS